MPKLNVIHIHSKPSAREPTNDEIMRQLGAIALAYNKWACDHDTRPLYELLSAIFECYANWKSVKRSKRIACRAALLTSSKKLGNSHPIAVIIAVATTADRRT